jgi:hypothetical protein
MTTKSPRDANGRTFGEFYAQWLGRNLLRYRDGARTSANIAGVLFDADFHYELNGNGVDANNDLVQDNAMGPGGENWQGKGMDDFYRRVRNQLPGKYVVTGHQLARGFDVTHGTQMETWIDYGNGDYNPNPKYRKVNEMFAQYLFNMSDRGIGPALVHVLTKTPTRQYPGRFGAKPNSNAPFRFAFTMALMEDGYFGTHSELEPRAWWDEYAVFTNKSAGNFGRAVPKSDVAAIRANRGWLGRPLGKFERVYDEASYQPGRNLLVNGGVESNTNGWAANNVAISRDTGSKMDGTASLRVSSMFTYRKSLGGATVRSPRLTVNAGQSYTVAFSLRSTDNREVRVGLGSASVRLPVGRKWRRYVVTLKPTRSQTTAVSFAVGMDKAPVWIDSVHVFRGDANVFKREFQNGLVLSNATPQWRTVQVGPGYRRIAGNQDPAINNGQAVTQVSLPPYDGLVLVKTDATGGGGTGGGGSGGGGTGGGTGLIGDWAWRDNDGDGVQEAGEPGWGGLNVDLLSCSGAYIASTTTGNGGVYEFRNLAPGRYQIAVKAPANARLSPVGSRPGTNSVSPQSGKSRCVDITSAGEKVRGLDIGLVPTSGGGGGGSGGGTLGDRVWNDKNGDGIQNNAEPGLSGVQVRLRSCNGILRQTTTTGANGSFQFRGLPQEKFLLEYVLPNGARFSPRARGSNRGADSNAFPSTGYSECVDMKTQTNRPGVDAGMRF